MWVESVPYPPDAPGQIAESKEWYPFFFEADGLKAGSNSLIRIKGCIASSATNHKRDNHLMNNLQVLYDGKNGCKLIF